MSGSRPASGPLGPDVAVTHILVVSDPAASRDFWTNALGAERGVTFLTPPHDWGGEIRCFLRDPDGHLVELSQAVP
jgi:catechol 2,3-dioxygenase-like lactoylglutathione lyase family enzyme